MNEEKEHENFTMYKTPEALLNAQGIEPVEKLRLLKEWEQELRESVDVAGKDNINRTVMTVNLHDLLQMIDQLEKEVQST